MLHRCYHRGRMGARSRWQTDRAPWETPPPAQSSLPPAARRSVARSIVSWWFRPGWSLVWRVPLFLVLIVLCAWFGFRGLVHLAFIFDANPLLTFVFAPALLPFAALPALCFIFCLRGMAWVWRNPDLSPGKKNLASGGAPLVALFLAQVLDLVQINLIRLMGIHLPRLPFDP